MIALTKAITKRSIWVNPYCIQYFLRVEKGTDIRLMDVNLLVAEAPEEIERKINNLLYHKE